MTAFADAVDKDRTRLTIESVAAGGDGVGRVDGLAVFVPRSAPGDVVEIVLRRQRRLGRGEIVRVVTPSPLRADPLCRHYDGDQCGGCQLQHLSLAAQLDAKHRLVKDAFQRIARMSIDLPPVVSSPEPWGYRSRLTLSMKRISGKWIIGMHVRRHPDSVFQLEECPITNPGVVAAWKEIHAASDSLPAASELRGCVRLSGGNLSLVLEGGSHWKDQGDFVSRCPALAFVRWLPEHGADRIIFDRRSVATPDDAFDQVNQPVAQAAREALLDRVLGISPRTAIDAYAGLGSLTGRLVASGLTVTSIEVDERAAAYAARRLPAARVISGRVEDHLAGVLPADVVILNPPRTGLDPRVTEVLQNGPHPRRILYMSCDPATLARDVGRLPSWRVSWIRAWDMFPQTAHVETVCELSPTPEGI